MKFSRPWRDCSVLIRNYPALEREAASRLPLCVPGYFHSRLAALESSALYALHKKAAKDQLPS